MRAVIILASGCLLAMPAGAQTARTTTTPLPAPDATLAAEFTQVIAIRELRDGRVLIVDQGERALFVADFAKGTATRIGRNGSGPQEYEQPAALLAIAGDSTIVPDPRNGRWLLLNGAEIAGTLGPDAPVLVARTRTPNGADVRGNIIALKSIATGSTPTAMPRLDSLLLVRMARSTGAQDTIAMLRARPSVIRTEGPANAATAISIMTNPLAAGETAALFPDGWIAIARLDPYRVEWVGPAGQRVTGPALPFERVRLDEREQRAFLQRESERTGRPLRDAASLPEWPEFVPPFVGNALQTAPDGRLWIRRTGSSGNLSPPYDVIDRRGGLAGRVAPGTETQVVGFGRAAVYTVVVDENGIQKLQRRKLPRID